ncbi:MAG TPA: hypothetical protein DEU93_09255 [Chitinophagaceae bacterium]|nr:hypothetical protein [Chitinophagaceae bacterium]
MGVPPRPAVAGGAGFPLQPSGFTLQSLTRESLNIILLKRKFTLIKINIFTLQSTHDMKNWLNTLPSWLQLILVFLFNILLWLCLDMLFTWIGIFDAKPIKVMLLKAVTIGIVWTLFFNWNYVRMVFPKKQS